jgi:hypothetical protein
MVVPDLIVESFKVNIAVEDSGINPAKKSCG